MAAQARTVYRRPYQFSISFLLLMMTLCGGLTCVGRLATQRIEGQDAPAAEANAAFTRTLCTLRVPPTASHVDYLAVFQGGDATFDISEADFLRWADTHAWQLEAIEYSDTAPARWKLRGYQVHWPDEVKSIWYYSNVSHRGGWSVMYDCDRNRAYVSHSAR